MTRKTHGSEKVEEGKLKGATDTDYFYFVCPDCSGNQVLRILDLETVQDQPGNKYNDILKTKATRSFILRFNIACEKCGLNDVVKISNIGLQGGSHPFILE
ncbi:MAG TPA: hypothetical protein VG733_11180 [Chthoniobacteraceae bacterium]|nr:hypothetical protein [Chthoniobacteraceae bacterium]